MALRGAVREAALRAVGCESGGRLAGSQKHLRMRVFAGSPSQRGPRVGDRRCPSRAGRDRALPASDRGRTRRGVSPRLLACDSLVGSPRKERCHPHDRASPKGEGREELCAWATARRVSGVRAITWSCSRFVSIAEVDRRRLASAAWTRPRRSGLAPPARADGGRKRVGSRPSGGKAAGTVAGHDGPCESRSRAAPVEGRRSGQPNSCALTSGWRKRL